MPVSLLRRLACFSSLLLCSLFLSQALYADWPWAGGSKPRTFLPAEEALSLVAEQNKQGLRLYFKVAPGHYLYRDRFRFQAANAGIALENARFPEGGEWKDDPTFGRVLVYHNDIEVLLPLRGEGDVRITWQGCADAGLCYPPQTETVPVVGGRPLLQAPPPASLPSITATAPPTAKAATSPEIQTPASHSQDTGLSSDTSNTDADSQTGNTALPETSAPEPASPSAAPQSSDGQWLSGASTPVILATLFLLGLGLAFTPCVLPMLPILSGIIVRDQGSTRRSFLLSLTYVMGVASTYALTGLLVGAFGASANLPVWFQHPVVLGLFALLFVILALSMFGLFELGLPSGLQNRFDRLSRRHEGGRYAGAYIMGFFSALVVSPCVSAPLAGVLLFISTTGNAALGAVGLFVLALGMGIPLLILGATEGRLLPRAGDWMIRIRVFFGILLLGVAISLLARMLPGSLTLLLWAALATVSAVWLGALEPVQPGPGHFWKGLGVLLLIYSAILVIGAATGNDDPLKPLSRFSNTAVAAQAPVFQRVKSLEDVNAIVSRAHAEGRTVMLDFYADWCISCKVMERDVFQNPEIAPRLQRMLLLQADVTANDATDRALLKHFTLFGPPALLFFRDGQELLPARIQGEMNAAEFRAHLDRYLH